MIEFINSLTGGPMWVHESRVNEYLARGHKIADEATAAALAGDVSKVDTEPKTKKAKAKKPKE